MRVRRLLAGLLALPVASFAGCGDDEAASPSGLDASSDGSPTEEGGAGGDAGPPTEKSSCVTYIEA